MSNEITINTTDFKQRVKDHVINTFGSLIPEDQMVKMIDAEMMDFFNTPTQIKFQVSNLGYNRQEVSLELPSTPFKQLVWTTLVPMVQQRLRTYFTANAKHLDELLTELIAPLDGDPELGKVHHAKLDSILQQMTRTLFRDMIEGAIRETKRSIANNLNANDMPGVAEAVMDVSNRLNNGYGRRF